VVRRDVADPTHIRRKVIDLVNILVALRQFSQSRKSSSAKSSAGLVSNSAGLMSAPLTQIHRLSSAGRGDVQ